MSVYLQYLHFIRLITAHYLHLYYLQYVHNVIIITFPNLK